MTDKKYIVDLSQFQKNIDFDQLCPILAYAFVRVQAGYTHPDPNYKTYVAGLKAHGIFFGTYAYFLAISIADAIKEAESALKLSDKDSTTFVVDVERVTTQNAADLVPAIQAYVDYMKAHGVEKVGLYSGDYFYKEHGLDKVKVDFTWIARYPLGDNGTENDNVKPDVQSDLWQYSSKGKLPGIPGNYVDLDVIDGQKDLAYFTGIKPAPVKVEQVPVKKAEPAPVKKAEPSFIDYKVQSGDSLWKIAQAHHVNVDELIKANEAYKDLLPVGVIVKVPVKAPEVKPAPKPAAPKKEYIQFPKGHGTWKVYPLNKKPEVGNQVGEIEPDKFGGLEYEVLGHPYPDVVTIHTSDFGTVNVYSGDPNSKIIKK